MNCGICQRPLNHAPGRLVRPFKRIRVRKVMIAPAPKPGQGPPLGISICGHLFHKLCLINYWDCGHKTCPRCRVEFNLRQVWNASLPAPQVPGECCRGFEELNQKKDGLQQESKDLQDRLDQLKRLNVQHKDAVKGATKRLKELEKNPVRKIIDKITP